ncbi:hypothetical protein SAMN04487959_10165 [Modicisalibacter xianhensis]|uniref:Uncharacterized protein n=1 Tax=Modicisalibacter xianhensis TaxID=442341 RepID=A0A1I2XUB6_9GAMM|nr:hypothetical protein SAMN04487959_10165 [Halomonas xianhensis]
MVILEGLPLRKTPGMARASGLLGKHGKPYLTTAAIALAT